MDIVRISKVQEQIVKDIIWAQEQKIQTLEQRIEQLERKQQPTELIGFHAKPSENSLEIAFPNRGFKGGD